MDGEVKDYRKEGNQGDRKVDLVEVGIDNLLCILDIVAHIREGDSGLFINKFLLHFWCIVLVPYISSHQNIYLKRQENNQNQYQNRRGDIKVQ